MDCDAKNKNAQYLYSSHFSFAGVCAILLLKLLEFVSLSVINVSSFQCPKHFTFQAPTNDPGQTSAIPKYYNIYNLQ